MNSDLFSGFFFIEYRFRLKKSVKYYLIVRLLIDKIIVSEKVKTESGYKRTVTIFLTHVGEIELP